MRRSKRDDEYLLPWSTIHYGIKDNIWVLPAFQRAAKWDAKRKEKFLRAVFDGDPVGALTVWKLSPDKQPEYYARSFIADKDITADTSSFLVLDGQQRLRAMLDFFDTDERDGRSSQAYVDVTSDDYSVRFFTKNSADSQNRRNKTVKYEKLATILSRHRRSNEGILIDGDRHYPDWVFELYDNLKNKDFLIDYARLMSGVEAARAFDQINSTGTKLDPKDLALTQLKAHHLELHNQLMSFLQKVHSGQTSNDHYSTLFNEKLITRLLCFYLFDTFEDSKVRKLLENQKIPSKSAISRAWAKTKYSILEVEEWLGKLGIGGPEKTAKKISTDALLVASVFWGHQYNLNRGKNSRSAKNTDKLTTWFVWANVVKPYKGGSTQQKVTSDARIVHQKTIDWKHLRKNLLKEANAADLEENAIETNTAGNFRLTNLSLGKVDKNNRPKINGFLKSLTLMILFRNNARDWYLQKQISHLGKNLRHDHHIFPINIYSEEEKPEFDGLIWHPANFTHIHPQTNQHDSLKKEPSVYLRDISAERRKEHLIPTETDKKLWAKKKHAVFLKKRTEMLVKEWNKQFNLADLTK